MKKSILLSLKLSLVFLSVTMNAQGLQPIFVNEFDSFLAPIQDTFHVDEALTDTINGEIWTRLYRSSFSEGSSSNGRPPGLIAYYQTESQKVYYSDGFRDGLMYDFSLEAGEEARVLPWAGSSIREDFMVYLVDSTKYMNCVFNDSVKVMYVRPYRNYSERRFYPFSNIWIEGIGDTQHPFPPESCLQYTSCEGINSWSQYYLNGTWYELWNSEGTAQLPCEEIITSTRSPVLNLPVKLSPNPVSAGRELAISVGNFSANKISLIGLADGRLVAEWRLGPTDVAAVTIPATLPAGVYVVVLMDRDGQLVREKVVVR